MGVAGKIFIRLGLWNVAGDSTASLISSLYPLYRVRIGKYVNYLLTNKLFRISYLCLSEKFKGLDKISSLVCLRRPTGRVRQRCDQWAMLSRRDASNLMLSL